MPLSNEAAARTTDEFQRVGENVREGFRLCAGQGNLDQRRDRSHQRPVQNEMRLDPADTPRALPGST